MRQSICLYCNQEATHKSNDQFGIYAFAMIYTCNSCDVNYIWTKQKDNNYNWTMDLIYFKINKNEFHINITNLTAEMFHYRREQTSPTSTTDKKVIDFQIPANNLINLPLTLLKSKIQKLLPFI